MEERKKDFLRLRNVDWAGSQNNPSRSPSCTHRAPKIPRPVLHSEVQSGSECFVQDPCI